MFRNAPEQRFDNEIKSGRRIIPKFSLINLAKRRLRTSGPKIRWRDLTPEVW